MNHNLAINESAIERYVLGEMTQTERQAFERHMFACDACTEEVRNAAEFLMGAREEFERDPSLAVCTSEDTRKAGLKLVPAYWFRSAIGAMAVAIVAVGFGTYQTIAAHKMAQKAVMAQVISSKRIIFEDDQKRGESGAVITLAKDQPVSIEYSIHNKNAAFYKIEIRTRAGNSKVLKIVRADEIEGYHIDVVVPAGVLEPGDYDFIVQGSDSPGADVAKGDSQDFTFKLEWKN